MASSFKQKIEDLSEIAIKGRKNTQRKGQNLEILPPAKRGRPIQQNKVRQDQLVLTKLSKQDTIDELSDISEVHNQQSNIFDITKF